MHPTDDIARPRGGRLVAAVALVLVVLVGSIGGAPAAGAARVKVSATVDLVCGVGGVLVALTNIGGRDAVVDVVGDPVVVPADTTRRAPVNVTIPVAEGAAYDVTVLGASATGVRDCERPGVLTALVDCALDGVLVELSNAGGADTVVQVNGEPVPVPAGTTAGLTVDVVVPVAEGRPYDITITGDGLSERFTGTRDCEQPTVGSVLLACAEGGVAVTLTNPGQAAATVLVASTEVVVPAKTTADSPVRVVVPVAEGATYEIRVVGDGLDDTLRGVRDCETPPSIDRPSCPAGAIAPTPSCPLVLPNVILPGVSTLPQTGSDPGTLILWAAGLLVTGAALVAGSRRRLGAGGLDRLP